jgi:hypothetical protein
MVGKLGSQNNRVAPRRRRVPALFGSGRRLLVLVDREGFLQVGRCLHPERPYRRLLDIRVTREIGMRLTVDISKQATCLFHTTLNVQFIPGTARNA